MFILKICLLYLFCMICSVCGSAQQAEAVCQNLIKFEKVIEDLSPVPAYPRWIDPATGGWKNQFAYIDDVQISAIGYMSDDLMIRGYIAKPKKSGKYPCIIYNRGGNTRPMVIMHAVEVLAKLASHGYVVIASQYRGAQFKQLATFGKDEFGGSDINDVLALLDVLKEVPEANTDQIGMYGWSRGGMMTYLALTKTDQIDVAIVGGAPSDLEVNAHYRPEMDELFATMMPNYKTNKKEELIKRSAINWVDKFPKNVPILMLHGNADWNVRSEHSLKMALKFDTYRIPYKLVIFEGAGHAIRERFQSKEREVVEWLDKYLKQDLEIPDMDLSPRCSNR